MESYPCINNSASSSSAAYSYSSSNSSTHFPAYQYQHEVIRSVQRPSSNFHSALHSIRRHLPAKKFITKKPSIAPMPPIPPKIYNVDPADFKDVVQKLTSAPEFHPTRLQEVAPPPLSLSPPHHRALGYNPSGNKPLSGNWDAGFMVEHDKEKLEKSFENTFGGLSPLGFSLSPSSLAMCSAFLLSPGSLASVEPNAVL